LLGRSGDSGNKTFAGHMTRKGESCEQREGRGSACAVQQLLLLLFFYLSKQASKGRGRGDEEGPDRWINQRTGGDWHSRKRLKRGGGSKKGRRVVKGRKQRREERDSLADWECESARCKRRKAVNRECLPAFFASLRCIFLFVHSFYVFFPSESEGDEQHPALTLPFQNEKSMLIIHYPLIKKI
jgi:hypothetical protein